ncbi:MAG: hypothetical protein HOV96_19590 [Nonomuraea sp.]|nr:hypothetical protein [Nonomuraea sp.]
MLADGSVTGPKLSFDAIDGKTITGAFIRTAADGTRWEIDSVLHADEIRGYTGFMTEVAPALVQVTSGGAGLLFIKGPDLGSGSASLQLSAAGMQVNADQGVTLLGNALGTNYVLVDPNSVTLTTANKPINLNSGTSPVSTSGDLVVGGTLKATGAIYTTTYAGTTDASGFLTVAHAAGFTPAGGWAVTTNPNASFAEPWGIDSITSTNVRLRFANVAGTGAAASTAVAGRLFLVRP